MLRNVWAGLSFGLVTLTLPSWCLAAPRYALLDLGSFGRESIANDINDAGQVVGQSRHPDGRIEAFRTQPNLPIDLANDGLGYMGGHPNDSYASAVNDLGQVIGSSWTSSAVLVGFALSDGLFGPGDDLDPPPGPGSLDGWNSNGSAINNRGQLVVSASPISQSDRLHAFRTSGLRPIDPATDDIGTLGGLITEAKGVNASGQVVGGSTLPGEKIRHAYRTGPDAPINPDTDDLGGLGGDFNTAFAINDIGQVVGVGTLPGGEERAFRTAPGAAINPLTDELGTLGLRSLATDINNSGVVVGHSEVGVDVWHAFVSVPGEPMADLNALLVNPIPGSVLSYALALNNAGQIVGTMHVGTAERAFLLTPVPEPSSVTLLILTVPALLRRRKDPRV